MNRKVLVRTYSAGVHFGTLKARKGKEIELTNARRIWRWYGANTLHEVALHGVDVLRSRISEPVKSIILTEAIEVLPITASAAKVLESVKWSAE